MASRTARNIRKTAAPVALTPSSILQVVRPMAINRAHTICQALHRQLLEGELKAGSKLPSERALALEYETSRPLVREALQILKSQGLIESRRGGGTFVSERYSEQSGSPLAHLLRSMAGHSKLNAELLEYRLTLEAQCAALAARRATSQDLHRLERAYLHLRSAHQGQELEVEAKADARFHLAIAEASHNRVFLHTLEGLFGLLKENVITNIGGLSRRPEIRARLMRQHTRLFEAIHRRDPGAARAAAEDHLGYVERFTEELHQERLELEQGWRR